MSYSLALLWLVTYCFLSVEAEVPGPPQSARVRIIDDNTLEVFMVEPPIESVGYYNLTKSNGVILTWGPCCDIGGTSQNRHPTSVCMKAGSNSFQKVTSESSPLCGYPASQESLWRLIPSSSNGIYSLYSMQKEKCLTYSPLSFSDACSSAESLWYINRRGHHLYSLERENKCALISTNGDENVATMYSWGTFNNECGLSGSYTVLSNRQALWKMVPVEESLTLDSRKKIEMEKLFVQGYSLRLSACNSNGCGPSINISTTCNIPTSGSASITSDCILYSQIVVTGNLNVTGVPDANGVLPKIIGGGSNRLFKVESGGELVLKYLNLTGGDCGCTVGADGGAILVDNGRCVMSNMVIWGNKAGEGGGIRGNNGAVIKLFNSTVANNIACRHSGGGIYMYNQQATVYIEFTAIFNNVAEQGGGGGVFLHVGSKGIISLSKIFRNKALITTSSHGGGGVMAEKDAVVIVRDSEIRSNVAPNSNGNEVFSGKASSLMPMIYFINVDFNNSWGRFGGTGGCTGTDGYCGTQSCSDAPTQCADNGYHNAICTTRQNPDEGVICAQNCSTGYEKAGTFNHTCVACSVGTYNPSWNQYQCQPWSDCTAGQYISTNGTSSSDRVCISCESGKFFASTNAYSCTDWTNCVAGQKIASNGTSTSDRICEACPTGTFSTATNQNACTNWTTCNPTTEVESGAGSTTADRVCATAGSPSPSGGSPSPAGSPTPAGTPSPAESSPSPADAPSPSDNSTSSTEVPSPSDSPTTTAAPNSTTVLSSLQDKIDELSIGSCNQPVWFTTMFLIAWSVLQW